MDFNCYLAKCLGGAEKELHAWGMKTVLVISSFVAGSNVGGGLAMKVLPQLGLEAHLLPTVMLGRHPGWGAPGGGAVPFEIFQGMADGLNANDIPAKCDGVITGYFASREQVNLAADLIEAEVKGRAPVIIDPVLGDEGKGLYVKEEVAISIADRLLPLADVITPNAFELAWLKGRLSPKWFGVFDVFETSALQGEKIGVRGPEGDFAGNRPIEAGNVPNGVGDLATLLIASGIIKGEGVDLGRVVETLHQQITKSDDGELSPLL